MQFKIRRLFTCNSQITCCKRFPSKPFWSHLQWKRYKNMPPLDRKDKFMRRIIVSVIFTAIFFTSSAYAEFLVKDYKKLKGSNLMQIYVEGLGKGFVYGNVVMKIETKKSLFCKPDKLVLEKDNFIRILDDEIGREEAIHFDKAQEASIEILLLSGLRNTFPCTQSK